ncbi:MAG: translation initiation factor IF-3 [Verrucomicrobiae bacterium]|nr:translation initiation factor IF-3 [Verrucomicrobiae bacterium]
MSMKYQTRVNHQIRSPEIRVIGETGDQLGVLPVSEALKMAMSKRLDLVEVSPDARPPVCRIVDFGKYRYEQAKKHRGEAVKHSHSSKLKELKFHVNISEHDYAIKVRHASEFLQKGMRVKVTVNFRGREMAHQEYGQQLMVRALADLNEFGHSDASPRMLGKNLHSILVPGKSKFAKPGVGSGPGSAAVSLVSPAAGGDSAGRSSFGTNIKIDLKPLATGARS